MAKILVGAMAAAVVALFVFMLTRLSTDALGMAIGVLFGVLAGVPSALLVLASSRKPTYAEEDDDIDYDQLRRRDMRRLRQQQGERDLPPYPYQPPVIVLAAPVEQPQVVNNYTDNRSVTIHKPVASVPSIYDRQRQVAAERSGRVFRVVGEREEWDA